MLMKKNRKPTRFSFECYINPSPQSLNEAHSRYMSGEVFLSYKGGIKHT